MIGYPWIVLYLRMKIIIVIQKDFSPLQSPYSEVYCYKFEYPTTPACTKAIYIYFPFAQYVNVSPTNNPSVVVIAALLLLLLPLLLL